MQIKSSLSLFARPVGLLTTAAFSICFASVSIAQTSGLRIREATDDSACSSADLEREAWLAAITAAAEARGETEPDKAMALVIEVIANRVCARFMRDDTVEKVVRRPWQFSAWNADSPMLSDLNRLSSGDRAKSGDLEAAAVRVLPIAREILTGNYRGELPQDVLHYAALAHCQPYWADSAKVSLKFGGHTFFSDVR